MPVPDCPSVPDSCVLPPAHQSEGQDHRAENIRILLGREQIELKQRIYFQD